MGVVGPLLHRRLDAEHVGLVDGLTYLGEDPDVDLADLVHLGYNFIGDLGGEEVVDLPDVPDGVFPARRLHAHGAVEGDEAVGPVAPADGAVVPHLRGGPRDGEVDGSGLGVVGDVQLDLDLPLCTGADVLLDLPDDHLLRLHVVGEVVEVPSDHGAGDGEVYDVSGPHRHHLDVLADGRDPLLQVHEEPLGVVDDGLRLGEGGVADAEGGVVGAGDLPLEDVLEVGGAGPDPAVEDDVVADVDVAEDASYVLLRRPPRDDVDGDLLLFEEPRSPPGEEDVYRLDDLAAAEGGAGPAGDDLGLVGVVVEDRADPTLVLVAEGAADRLRQAVGDAVGVADPLPLHKLDHLLFDWLLAQLLDLDISRHAPFLNSSLEGLKGSMAY